VIQHLTPADYTTMPWANGRGQTVELIRQDGPDGALLWRLSMASVVEDGPFSIFPGVERNLTVISGPGFDLVGKTRLTAAPLMPVGFPGDVPIGATGVTAPSNDFNVLTARSLPLPNVQVLRGGDIAPPTAGLVAVFALEPAIVAGHILGKHDLIITNEKAHLEGGLCIGVGLSL
jgi:uncharacterized protein